MHEPALTREAARDALARTAFDLLVVGGGVIGAATAAHAAREGLAVALVDAGDFGSGTSSASSKLVHGGLRYLRLGDVRLVREAHHERRTLTRSVAPHLVHRLPFLLPLYRGGPFRPWVVQGGILLYSALARSRLNWLVKPERADRLVPALRRDGLESCALYADAWTNDARLCLENVVAASDAGATVLNRARVVALVTTGGRVSGAEVEADGEVVPVRARVVVNAAGPWVDHVRRLEDRHAGASVRLSKGAHVLVPGGEDWTAALTVPQDDVRVTFAVPWYGLLLLGTTDTDYDDDPGAVAADEDDIAEILGEASKALPGSLLGRDAVRASFAGLRVLPLGEDATASVRRETVFSVGRGGMLSVAGGKLTTYRQIARSTRSSASAASSGCAASIAGRSRFRVLAAPRRRCRSRSIPRSRHICATSTAAGRPASSPARETTRRFSSGSTAMGRTSSHRPGSRPPTSGRRRPETCSGDGQRWRFVVSPTRVRSRGWRQCSACRPDPRRCTPCLRGAPAVTGRMRAGEACPGEGGRVGRRGGLVQARLVRPGLAPRVDPRCGLRRRRGLDRRLLPLLVDDARRGHLLRWGGDPSGARRSGP
ncbi:MAG: FAD-dependent oxidoreductase [Gaiella sp.]|nr:FAD-dependent oxidoreductase [Gaiella sp.]